MNRTYVRGYGPCSRTWGRARRMSRTPRRSRSSTARTASRVLLDDPDVDCRRRGTWDAVSDVRRRPGRGSRGSVSAADLLLLDSIDPRVVVGEPGPGRLPAGVGPGRGVRRVDAARRDRRDGRCVDVSEAYLPEVHLEHELVGRARARRGMPRARRSRSPARWRPRSPGSRPRCARG